MTRLDAAQAGSPVERGLGRNLKVFWDVLQLYEYYGSLNFASGIRRNQALDHFVIRTQIMNEGWAQQGIGETPGSHLDVLDGDRKGLHHPTDLSFCLFFCLEKAISC
jgi:hypothetical protein